MTTLGELGQRYDQREQTVFVFGPYSLIEEIDHVHMHTSQIAACLEKLEDLAHGPQSQELELSAVRGWNLCSLLPQSLLVPVASPLYSCPLPARPLKAFEL